MREGDRLYSGTTATKIFADRYNRLSEDIRQKEKVGMAVEALKNGRHNFFQTFALPMETDR